MANKKELASELEKLTGQPVDSDALTRDELEQALAEAQAQASQDAAATDQAPAEGNAEAVTGTQTVTGGDEAAGEPPAGDQTHTVTAVDGDADEGDGEPPDPDELVEVVLGKDAPVGRLLVGRAAIERHQPGRAPARITRAEFEQHRGLYKLEVPEGDPETNPSLAKQLKSVEKGS